MIKHGCRFSLFSALCALTAALTAQASDCYWAGGTSSDWGTVANWTTGNKVPTGDGAYFRSDKFNNNFKSGNRAYLVTFDAAHTNTYRTYFNNCGTASAPIILRGSNASYGLTSGDSTTKDAKSQEGIYIGTNQTGGNSGTTDSNASTGNAYVRFETGTYATCNTYSYFFLGNNSYDGYMTVAGATINASSDFKIFSGALTIESGTVNLTYWMRFESNSRAKAINLNGGTLHTYRINKQGGSGAATVNFNGGTLRIKQNDATVIESGVAVKVKANGGTIDVNGTTSTIPASFSEDSSSTGGGMKFCGGGTLTLSGSIGYTGGTTIEAGTTVKVATVAQKDALLGSGLNTLKVIPASGTHTLITITGDGVFSDTDLLKVALVPGSAGAATFSLSADNKSLIVDIPYNGGEINQSTPTLVFPGATLADLATHTLRARFQGSAIDADGTEATFFNRVETVDNDVLTKVTYQLQVLDENGDSNHYTKAAKVEFTADASGVYAKLIDGDFRNYGSPAQFGTDPLTSNPGTSNYLPYDFRLVEPATAISVNFTRSANLDTSSSVRYGAGDYAVPYTSWNNMAAANNGTATFGGATVKITKTSGPYGCSNLNSAKDVRHGYLDDSGLTVVVDVTNIPYEFYRIVTYHATDNKNIKFGHVTIDGVNYTGATDATVRGNATWGATGAANYSYGLREGVNYLVSDVMSGSSVTITGHRDKSSSPTCRGCIAAIQIVEYVPTTYTATISDGGAKTFSALTWDKTLPALLTANDRIVVNVNEDTTLNIDIPVDVYGITFNVADGKTLTLSGNNIAAQYITATGAGQTVVASASQLAGTVKGDGTLVYGAAPSGLTLTDSLWSGVLWLKNCTMNGLLAQNLASANSTLRLTGVTGYFNNGDSEMTCLGTLELVDDGATAAFTVSNGFSANGKTVFAAVKGDGTFKSDTTTSQRYVFKDVSAFTGTIDIPSGKNTRVIFDNGTSLSPASGTITVASGATVTIAAGKTWTANGGIIVNGTLMLGAGATAPAVVSGTGTVGVTSGTGTINGYDSAAALTLATESGATLAITNDTLTAMTIGGLANNGTLDLTGTALTEATLNLATGVTAPTTGTILYPATFAKFVVSPADQSVRSLADFTTLPTLPEGATYYVTVAETREEFGKGSMIVTNCAASVNVRVARPNGTFIDMTPADGTITLTEAVQIAGAATAFDATYTNTVEYAYRAPGWNAGSGQDVKPPTYNNQDNDETTGMYILHHPWVSNVMANINALGDFTLVVVGKMSPSRSTQFIHIGSASSGLMGLLITTTENEDEVLIAKNTGNSVDAENGVKASVPNAATARHAYVINKKGTVFEVWVDGVKRGQFDTGDGFTLGSTTSNGIQIGSDISGAIKNAGIYKGVPNAPETETGVINVVRLFDYSITEAQAEAVFNTYPYVSQGGLFTRTVAADGTFSETDAWEKDGAEGTFDVPEGATVDEVYYNPSATLTVNAAAEIGVNASVSIETLTVGGTAPVAFTADGTHTLTVVGAARINSPVTNEYGAVYLAGAPVQLGSSGAICFDCSGVDVSKVYAVTRFQLTGLTDRDDEKFSLIPPADPDRSYEIVYNTTGSCYDLVVTPLHNYIVVENQRTTTFTVDGDTIIVGAGGLNIETLVSPEDGRIVFDPVKTPIYVWGADEGALTISNGTQFVLTPNYAGMTLGRLVLLTYREDYAELPENLSGLFDASSIAADATYAITSEDAPDPAYGRKQLVLTVGNYDRDAKEIRILPVGDSITQGVAANSGNSADYYPQYRSTIAARLAASGYKPKMLGVWKRANYDGSHVMVPDDWAWHCGISAERIIAGGNRGGVEDNMHVYLDIAGDVNAITFLIGTNDLGADTPVADTYAAYTNLMFETATQRPNAKLIGATILDRNGAESENHARVVEFNALLRADYAANRLPANFVMLDLYDAVPLAETGNFLSDNLHLHWKGCVATGEAFAGAIMSALPLTGAGAISGDPDPTVTDAVQTALGAANIAELADYRAGMTKVYTIDAAATNGFTTAPYTTIDDTSALTRPVLKAGYYMELVRKGTSRRRYVWVDFDATGKTLGDIDFPWEGANLDFVAEQLHVYSNDPSIHNVAANDNSVNGVVEGSCHNYSAGDDNDQVPADVSAGYGWNDTLQSNAGYGCFQVHRILSETDAEVLFAWNCWGDGRDASVDDIGIGSFAKSTTLGSDFSMDYTFTSGASDGAADTLTARAYSVRRVEIWAVFDGAVRHGVWSGLGGNADFDTPANWEDGIVPSVGENIDFSAIPAATTIAVTGASTNKTFGTATMGSNVVTFSGDIAFTNITDSSKIAVGENSTVTLDGNLEITGSGDQVVVDTVAAGGRFVVTGDIVAKEDFTGYLFQCRTCGGGAVQARGVVNNSAGKNSDAWAFRLGGYTAGTAYWIVGDRGFSGSKNFWTYKVNGTYINIRPLDSDFAISTGMSTYNATLTFDTMGADGNPHAITVGDGGLLGNNGPVNVSGAGRFVVDAVNTLSGTVAVTNTATLAVIPGKTMTTGEISVADGATYQVAESGTNTVTTLTLADGAILGFNFNQRKVAPVLEVTTSATLPENGTVKVMVTAANGVRPTTKGNKFVLTSGGKFTGANVSLAEGSATWANGVSVDENGNIVVEVKKSGAVMLFR
ncbi:MAG: hypothetical protein J6T51_07685 [Kiritimatiellae bacterium]|nr:hypothetical protein [Kiritimatiellia bacterium]